MKHAILSATLLTLLAVAAAPGLFAEDAGTDQKSVAPDTAPKLVDLKSHEELSEAFNSEKDRPRLVLLLSPT